MTMKVNVLTIKEGGIDVEGSLSREYIGLTQEDFFYFLTPLTVSACVERFDATLISHVKVSGRYASTCCRSLEKIERDWVKEFTLDYPLDQSTECIELDEDIRQEIILNIPQRVLADSELDKEKNNEQSESDALEEEPQTEMHRPFEHLKIK